MDGRGREVSGRVGRILKGTVGVGRSRQVSGGHRQGLPGFQRGQQMSRGVDRCWESLAGVSMCRGGGHRQRLTGFRRGQQVSRGVGRFRGSSAGVGMSRGGISMRRVASAGGGHIGSDSLMLFAALIYCIFSTTGGKDTDG